MNCKQCGAPMELIRERDYYHCEYCDAYHFPSSSPDGVRILGENPEGVNCPLCQVPLNMATFDDHYRGYQCSQCQGLLFNRTSFRKTIDARRAKATTPAEPPAKYRKKELNRRVECPVCSQSMGTHQYMGPGNIIIDTCDTCDLIWLDYGELSKVVNAPGKDRGVGQSDRYKLHWEKTTKEKGKQKPSNNDIDLLDLIEDIFF